MNEEKAAGDLIDFPEENGLEVDSGEGITSDIAEDQQSSTLTESQEEVEPTVEQRLAEAEAKAAEYLDGWQRARAEFANARKRLERERIEAYSNAGVDYVTKLLPIIDDLKRALDSAPQEIKDDPWYEGLDLVNRKFQTMLDTMGVKSIEALDQPFDPNLHEALALRDVEGVESGVVIEELQTGYQLGDRVIRPSLVNVSA